MKKKIFLGLFLILILIANISMASYSTVQMEVVEEPVCTIELGENASFEKRLIEKNLTNKEVTIQLQVVNNESTTKPTGELVLVLDNSNSMNETVDEAQTTTRKDLIFESAKTLISNLLENNDDLQIGIVSFSSYYNPSEPTDISQEATLADANVVSNLSTDASALSLAIDNIEANGPRTDLDAGITLASQQFTEEANNKYMIVLTDGVPNISLDHNNPYYSDDTINATKTKLQQLDSQGIQITTMLTGISNEDEVPFGNTKTYGQIITEIFGTEESPTVGNFYYVTDDQAEETITTDIYNSLLPVSQSYTDIVIKDYFPQEIIDNFEFAYVSDANIDEISAEVDPSDNSITWTIPELASGETATVQYTLKLKENFDSSIVNKLLDTNERVDITYKDFNNEDHDETSDVTPVLRLTEPPAELPKAGLTTILIILAVATIGLLTFSLIKLNTYKNIK